MPFISYAQNYEDVMLARALRGVEVGFYIDVGAQDPDADSVTKHFYESGWRGMNFEPSATYHARMEEIRPRDINLRCAVGAEVGSITFYEAEGSGLSTIIESVSDSSSEARTAQTVPMTTLDTACATYGVSLVHFLKIDVEGAEELVLRGASFTSVRPWIVVVEATHPNSPEPYYEHWEPLLTGRGYRFVYADGLNRFYLAEEHAELAEHFVHPPNHFDRFVRASEVQADLRAEQRAADNLAHHIAIIDRLGVERSEQQGVLEEHVRKIETMSAQLAEQQAEIGRLVGLLDLATRREQEAIAHHVNLIEKAHERHRRQSEEAAAHASQLGARIRDLETLVAREIRQIAFRDDKIAWVTQDRDRFRAAHAAITQSALWRATGPLQGKRLRAATRALSVRAGARLAEPTHTVVHAPQVDVQAAELPDTARWIEARLSQS